MKLPPYAVGMALQLVGCAILVVAVLNMWTIPGWIAVGLCGTGLVAHIIEGSIRDRNSRKRKAEN